MFSDTHHNRYDQGKKAVNLILGAWEGFEEGLLGGSGWRKLEELYNSISNKNVKKDQKNYHSLNCKIYIKWNKTMLNIMLCRIKLYVSIRDGT